MVFCIRDEQQRYQDCRGTEISQNRSSKHIPAKEINLQVTATTDISGHRYPTSCGSSIIELPLIFTVETQIHAIT